MITKKIHIFKDSDNRYRRCLWDSFYVDGVFVGLAPVPFGEGLFGFTISSQGAVTLNNDLLDEADNFEVADIILEADEETFLDNYDDVCFLYESKDAQTYETDYHSHARQF
jgi:hypothetical protein